jgi:hypothetical protein
MLGVVVTVLMDLPHAAILIRVVAVAALLWLVIMFALMFSDYLSRSY